MKTIHLIVFLLFFVSCVPRIDEKERLFKEITCEQTYISLADSLDFHFIPLETNDSCLIGSIAAVQIVDDRIFLLEGQKREALFVFDMNGKFKQQIGKKGGGPEEYQYISSFDIDTERRLIALADPVRERILFYDLDTYQFKQALHPKFYYNQFRLLPNRNVLFFFANGFENAEDLNDNASYYVLEGQNPSRRDDLISWFYSMIELSQKQTPWPGNENKNEARRLKISFTKNNISRATPGPSWGSRHVRYSKKAPKTVSSGAFITFYINCFYSAVSNSFWNFSIEISFWLSVTDSLMAV